MQPPLDIGTTPTLPQLEEFARSSREAGKKLVVGALVVDPQGRIYVQRRSEERALFPGCWDIVGGHAEPGETVLDALRRELTEETGWRLEQFGPVVEVVDWSGSDGGQRREVDLLVTVRGDLSAPQLEPGKHTGGRWVTHRDLPLLTQARDPGDTWVRAVVERALELAQAWNR